MEVEIVPLESEGLADADSSAGHGEEQRVEPTARIKDVPDMETEMPYVILELER